MGLEYLESQIDLDKSIIGNENELSGGEVRRILIARTILSNSNILIFDDPLAGLDKVNAALVEDSILEITGKTVILVSHIFNHEKEKQFDDILNLENKRAYQ